MRTRIAALAVLSLLFQFAAIPGFAKDETVPAASSKHRPTVALALGGGGTRGAAHVGVLKVLEQEHIPVDYIVGTSMGAIVGGLYSAGDSTADLEKRFDDCSLMKAFMTVPLWVRVLASPILIIPRLLGEKPYDGLYWGNKFRKYLLNSVPASKHDIEELKIPFQSVSVNLIDGKVYTVSKGNLGYALQASSAVPGLRKPVQIGDKLFVDGGVANNVPAELARNTGADVVIAVNVDEAFDQVPLDDFRKVGSVTKRMVNWTLWDSDSRQAKFADVIIHPDTTGIGLVSTKKSDAVRAIAAGEAATRAQIDAIKKAIAEKNSALVRTSESAPQ